MAVKNKGFVAGAAVGACVAGAALAGAGLQWPRASADPADGRPEVIKAQNVTRMFAPPPGAPLSFADIIERVSPAVVSIDAKTRVDANALRRSIPGLENFPFDLVPRNPDGAPGDNDNDDLPEAQSSGSGFFIRGDGYIVTNNHVVENAEEITVTLNDQRELKARIVGRDEGSDLAVLKVEGNNFPFVTFATGARPRVGDWIIAVGNPFQLGGTATSGIISAYGRDIGEQFVDYIQIDAPINRGNSGGPTFDVYGRVIGVNTAIFSPSGGSVGIGFAIPADTADQVTKQLIAGGRVDRGYLGATVQTVTEDIAESQGLGERRGALIADVVPGGPGARAGLQVGDIVLSINGKKVEDNTDLTRQVAATRAGDVMRLEVFRGGRTITADVRAGTRPSERELAANDDGDEERPAGPTPPVPSAPAVLGMSLAPLDEASRRRYDVDSAVRGVVVTAVDRRSDAGRKGLRAGDVVVQANFRPVGSPAEIVAAVAAARQQRRENILLLVHRDGRTLFLPVRLAE